MTMARATDIGFVRFTAPDLEAMETFLADFGLVRAERQPDRLYMKAHDGAPFVHVTERGDPGFAGLGFELGGMEDLERLASETGRPVEPMEEPGGGHRVRLEDPDGFQVDAVFRPRVSALPLLREETINRGFEKPRLNQTSRSAAGPAEVVRIGHCVLNVTDFRKSEAWYKAHFGLITSDEIEAGPDTAFGAFLRCDQGDRPVDHHTLFLVGTGTPSFNHAAFEVDSYNRLMAGHHHLKECGYTAYWGVGRHILGSQIFDYWKDPWGHVLEHWTDGDLFNAASGGGRATFAELMGTQWGPSAPKIIDMDKTA